MFKVGDKVICIDNQDREEDLVYGEVYTVLQISTYADRIRLKEFGVSKAFNRSRFELFEYTKKFEVKNKPFIE